MRRIVLALLLSLSAPAFAQEDLLKQLDNIKAPRLPVGNMVTFGGESGPALEPIYTDFYYPPIPADGMTPQQEGQLIRELRQRHKRGGGDGYLRSAVRGATIPRIKAPPIGKVINR